MLGHLFCKLDSDRYPIRTFGYLIVSDMTSVLAN